MEIFIQLPATDKKAER